MHFRGIFSGKATGIGVVAGGVTESFVLCGIAGLLTAEAASIVFLVRAFEPGRGARNFFAGLSICAGGIILLLVVLFIWLFWLRPRPTF